jgi:hypothetical protein
LTQLPTLTGPLEAELPALHGKAGGPALHLLSAPQLGLALGQSASTLHSLHTLLTHAGVGDAQSALLPQPVQVPDEHVGRFGGQRLLSLHCEQVPLLQRVLLYAGLRPMHVGL